MFWAVTPPPNNDHTMGPQMPFQKKMTNNNNNNNNNNKNKKNKKHNNNKNNKKKKKKKKKKNRKKKKKKKKKTFNGDTFIHTRSGKINFRTVQSCASRAKGQIMKGL